MDEFDVGDYVEGIERIESETRKSRGWIIALYDTYVNVRVDDQYMGCRANHFHRDGLVKLPPKPQPPV